MLQESILQYFRPSLSYHFSKTIVLSIFEWPLKMGFTVFIIVEQVPDILDNQVIVEPQPSTSTGESRETTGTGANKRQREDTERFVSF